MSTSYVMDHLHCYVCQPFLSAAPIPDAISPASQPFIHMHPMRLDEVKLYPSFDPPIHHPPGTPESTSLFFL
ncbi:hypothetical protein EYC84_004902 [Monilinia fructicola]|uniref:Uncharacterized protein n=1 Tax=Monilinia fructicola TaxID=38448 RepID=A0A5M9K1X7_MONFR|nr:hypothetical protein EYC84_004902 [Monilinia fructicola]